MITSADEYYAALFKINEHGNIPNLAVLLPRSEYIYNIDLETRVIESPEFLSVLDDHVSETIYFLVDRFYDNVDLSDTACIIQYINAQGDERIYQVPFYDIETYSDVSKMLIPWCIEGEATKAAGNVTYSVRFYKVDSITKKHLTFNLNTIPATSKVLQGLRIIDSYIQLDNLLEEDFNKNKDRYFIKTGEGEYVHSEQYDESQTYYTLIDSHDYYADKIETLFEKLSRLDRDTQLYWYDATDRKRM